MNYLTGIIYLKNGKVNNNIFRFFFYIKKILKNLITIKIKYNKMTIIVTLEEVERKTE
jgi:hypothetical protein